MSGTKRLLKAFLCHAHADKPKVRELHRYLRERGINPWLDEEDLVGGQDWQLEILKALLTSDAIIICLTKNSVDREGYIQKEIKFALDRAYEMPEGRIFLIPVRFEECEVPLSLSRFQWVDLSLDSGYAKIMRALDFCASQLKSADVEAPNQPQPPKPHQETPEKAAQEKVEREKAEKATREKQERDTAERPRREKVEHEIARKTKETFDVLILIGRPASGKSEIIDFLFHLPNNTRRERFHIAHLDILDDFSIQWSWFEEDDILSKTFGLPRLHSDEQGYFKYQELWHVFIERLSLDYAKKLRYDASYHDLTTTLIEFSRGSEHGGYKAAFQHVSDAIFKRAGIVYVHVPFEESLRKNRRRFNPEKPDSILEHGFTEDKMERLYRDDDWLTMAPGDNGHLNIRGQNVPYAVFPNADDVTTGKPDQLAARLESVLNKLWNLHRQK